MPFTAELDWIHGELIKAGRSAGYDVDRADDVFWPGVVIEQVEKSIVEADAIVAVCTGRNANVFYELGLAHAVHEAILVAEAAADLPFDIAHRRAILYGKNPVRLSDDLRRALEAIPSDRGHRVLRHAAGELLAGRAVQARGDEQVYWLDHEGHARPFLDEETVALYTRGHPIANVSTVQLDSLQKGPPMTPLNREALRRSNADIFALLDGYWHYLTTLAPVYKYGFASVRDLPELTEEERASHRILF